MTPESASAPFVVMFAGPNGSGKSTLYRYLRDAGYDFGVYINPDDIAAQLHGSYDVRVRAAQKIADQRREECIANRQSFSFETVMSHASKIELLQTARAAGFHVIVFFIATDDPEINVSRVGQRVALGGHDVPEDKIRARFHRSWELLPPALDLADEAFVFDNSGSQVQGGSAMRLVARYLQGVEIWRDESDG